MKNYSEFAHHSNFWQIVLQIYQDNFEESEFEI